MVDKRWAITNTVRSFFSSSNADWIARSDSVSSADVASSKIKTGELRNNARAMAKR